MFKSCAFAVIVLCAFFSNPAYSQCSKDTDCKGNRICVNGACVEPEAGSPAAPAPAPQSETIPTAPAPQPQAAPSSPIATSPAAVVASNYGNWNPRFFLEAQLPLNFATFGGFKIELDGENERLEYDLSAGFLTGIYTSASLALGKWQIGAYFTTQSGEGTLKPSNDLAKDFDPEKMKSDIGILSFGGSIKLLFPINSTVTLGPAVDMGMSRLFIDELGDDDNTLSGFCIYPRFITSINIFKGSGICVNIPVSFGSLWTLSSSLEATIDAEGDVMDVTTSASHASIILAAGIALGF